MKIFGLPGTSFSPRRALGIDVLKRKIATETGNAAKTPARMHYTILTPVPHFRLYDKVYGNGRQPEKFNWQKMFYLNPDEYLRSK